MIHHCVTCDMVTVHRDRGLVVVNDEICRGWECVRCKEPPPGMIDPKSTELIHDEAGRLLRKRKLG